MRRRFVTLDVFTSRPFAGNPLAVVLDAQGLEDAVMQAIAREFNLAETVFVLPAEKTGHRARLRIFTPAVELPFAGHPTVGTAVLLNRIDGRSDCEIVLEEGIGPVHCATAAIATERGRARFQLANLPAEVDQAASAEAIAAALGLKAEDIGFDDFKPSCWSAGISFTFVPVRGLDAIRRCQPNLAYWQAGFEQDGRSSAYVFCRETVDAGSATGAAAAAFSGVLVRFRSPADGAHDFLIEQGYEMGRPSLIGLSLTVQSRQLATAAISGEAIVISEGTIEA